MSIKDIFNFQQNKTPTDFSVSLAFPLIWNGKAAEFTEVFVYEFFHKILTDCFNKAGDFPAEKQQALWDSVLIDTDAKAGLISILARGMLKRSAELYLVYDGGFVREASNEEKKKIDANPASNAGAKISFTNFKKATVLLVLASLAESLLVNAKAGLKISESVLLKINALRDKVSLLNSGGVIEQARAIERGLKEGKGALLDAADAVEMPVFNSEPMETALDILFGLMSMVSGMPKAYVSGILTGGLNNTGEGDAEAVDRGLAYYFNSIFKPVCDKLFKTNLVFKSSNWRKFAEIANFLPVLEGVGEDILPKEYKEKLIKELFS